MVQAPSIREIEAARQAFEANEPRDPFYRAEIERVTLALDLERDVGSVQKIRQPALRRYRAAY